MKEIDKSSEEEELIRNGREMIQNGLGATFVYKWVRERVADETARGRILEAINKTNTNPMITSPNITLANTNLVNTLAPEEEELLKKRLQRKVKYLYEDFKESESKLKKTGILLAGLGFIFLLSYFLFNAFSLLHAVFSLLVGIGIATLYDKMDWEDKASIYLGIAAYLFILVFEYMLLGLPDELIPNLGEFGNMKWISAITLLNDFSPALYFCFKLALIYPFLKMLYFLSQLKKTPKGIRLSLGIKER